jgi:S-formylglutathione hydrolase FrmB
MLTGCSMGGFGVFHYMLAAPGEFIAISSMSGYSADWSLPPLHTWMFDILGPYTDYRQRYLDVDLRTGIRKQLAAGTKLPPIYMTIGTKDPFLQMNRNMHAFLTGLGIPCDYHEDSGAHTWQYWRDHSGLVIDFNWSVLQRQK